MESLLPAEYPRIGVLWDQVLISLGGARFEAVFLAYPVRFRTLVILHAVIYAVFVQMRPESLRLQRGWRRILDENDSSSFPRCAVCGSLT